MDRLVVVSAERVKAEKAKRAAGSHWNRERLKRSMERLEEHIFHRDNYRGLHLKATDLARMKGYTLE